MGQLQILGLGQKLNATSAEAAGQAAPALPGDPGGPGFKRSAIMLFGLNFSQAVLLLLSGCEVVKHVLWWWVSVS